MKTDYITIKHGLPIKRALEYLINAFNHHYERELKLAELCQKEFTQQQIADYLGITKSAVSLQYPKENRQDSSLSG